MRASPFLDSPILRLADRPDHVPVDRDRGTLEGLAVDGGLYVPETWPTLPDLTGITDYPDVAAEVARDDPESATEQRRFYARLADSPRSRRTRDLL